MPLCNRVRPDGRIIADPARGLMMGNRGGRIHDPATRQLFPRRRWASKRWIICVTCFKNRRRAVMGKGYTELFFLDDVTALAAGHRPCFECRRADATAFAEGWRRAQGLSEAPRADAMDDVLHAERTGPPRPAVATAGLPDGAMIAADDGRFIAIKNGGGFVWSLTGYAKAALPETARCLTPPAIVDVLRAGFEPVWHPSASA